MAKQRAAITDPDIPACALVACRICDQLINPEAPSTIRGINPETSRMAWMGFYCFVQAFEELAEKEATSDSYDNKQDEYIHRYCGRD